MRPALPYRERQRADLRFSQLSGQTRSARVRSLTLAVRKRKRPVRATLDGDSWQQWREARHAEHAVRDAWDQPVDAGPGGDRADTGSAGVAAGGPRVCPSRDRAEGGRARAAGAVPA